MDEHELMGKLKISTAVAKMAVPSVISSYYLICSGQLYRKGRRGQQGNCDFLCAYECSRFLAIISGPEI